MYIWKTYLLVTYYKLNSEKNGCIKCLNVAGELCAQHDTHNRQTLDSSASEDAALRIQTWAGRRRSDGILSWFNSKIRVPTLILQLFQAELNWDSADRLDWAGLGKQWAGGKGKKCVENSTLETFERGLQKIIPKGQTAWDNNGLCHGHWQGQPGELGREGDVSQLVS